jgi:hypothetical protein
MSMTKNIRVFVAFMCFLSPASAFAASTVASTPTTVNGFIPGYTANHLARTIDRSVASVPVPVAMTTQATWRFQVQVSNVYMPHVATVIKATLLDRNHVVASDWKRVDLSNAASPGVLCDAMADLTQQLWKKVPPTREQQAG